MLRKIFGFLLIAIGFLCLLLVGGGSMRYRNKSLIFYNETDDYISNILVLVTLPIIGFLLLWIGYKILKKYSD